MARSAFSVLALTLTIGAAAHAQVVGVLDSEYNRAEYPNADQAQLMERLGELQVRYRVIRDADVLHPQRREGVAAIATAHSYVVSEEIGDALVEYVRGGGRLLCEDGPVKSESRALLRMFGVREEAEWSCHYGRGFEIECLQPNHPLADTQPPQVTPAFVGNAFTAESIDPDVVIFQGTGEARLAGQTWDEKATHTVPAVVARELGEGSAMLLNWMALRTQEPQVRPWVDRLILRFLPADVVNDEYELTAELPVRTFFRQPMPLRLHVGYAPLDVGGAEEIRIQLALSRGAGRILA
ncbi:MAG: hypothetical protein U9R79_00125, partial [Armatimonadota bacterium]|nr:hypothetical protein [Armatimonadota bacterium]